MRIRSAMVLLVAFGVAKAASAGDFGFESLRELLVARNVATVEDLVALLPEDLRTGYTLVFSSRSLQDASFEHPRAILFGSSARLIVTFNGNASQHGFDAVETMEFDASANRFIFREITFGASDTPPAVRISDPNPARCIACHDRPARPIWDVPPAWPGVYGERYGAGLSGTEQAGMARFLSTQPVHPRYRSLLAAQARADRDTYVSSARNRYGGTAVEPPNAQLSTLLATLNVRSILARLAAAPGFDAHLSVLLAAAGSTCGRLAEFYPPSVENAVAADLKRFSAATSVADRRQSFTKALRQERRGAAYTVTVPAEFTELRYVAERGLDVSTQHWTLAFERGSFDLSAPGGSLTLEQALFEWQARTDPGLRTVATYRTFNPGDAYCEHLRRASRASLEAWYGVHGGAPSGAEGSSPVAEQPRASEPAQGRAPGPALLERCAACHGTGAAPPLPFGDPQALGGLLAGGRYPHGRLLDEILFRLTPQAGPARMPRGINIDADEQRELETYFIALAR
jgi:mono/diheme cytochrome c family protein